MNFNKIILWTCILVLTSCGPKSSSKDVQKKLDEFFSDHNEISATYLVALGKDEVIEGARGFFNKETKSKLKPTQQMPIAYGTKQMTAAMIMRLQERGVLSLHDTLVKFLPVESGWWPQNKVPDWAYKVTIHQLLSHSSGIAEYIPSCKFDVNMPFDKIKHSIVACASDSKITDAAEPKYSYCNTNYFFLGLIIEKLTNQDIATVFKKEFFEPLGMNSTHMASLAEATSFQNGQNNESPKAYLAIPTGATPKYIPAKLDFYMVPFTDGGVVSSVRDIYTWNQAFHDGKVVSEYSYKLMTTPYYDDIPDQSFLNKGTKVGYGIYIEELPDGQKIYYNSGRAVGIRSEHGYVPSSKLYYSNLSLA